VTASRGRWLFLLGVLLVFAGPVVYIIQFNMKQLVVPWYAPVLATLGVLLMLASVWRRPGVLRISGLVLFGLVCGFEWFFIVMARTPVYSGPANPGQKVPAFATTLADGTAFTDQELAKGIPTALVFFRGRW